MQYHTPQTTLRMLWYLSPLRRICVFAILPFWLSKCLSMLPSSLLLLFCVSSLQSTNTPRTPHTMNAFESVLRTKNRNQRQIFEQMCYSKLNAKYCKAGSETCLINSSRPILRYGLVYFACDIIPVWCTAKHNLNYDQKVQSVKVLLTTIFMVVWVFPICRIYQKTYKNAPDVDRPKRSREQYFIHRALLHSVLVRFI